MRFRCLHLLLAPALLCAQSLADLEKKVTQFSLANGLTFLIIERHDAPVICFHTYVNAGAVDDPSGSTGLAHVFERMAFKGTPEIGSKNWAQEKKALDAIEAAYDRLEAERNRDFRADPETIKTLEAAVKDAIATTASSCGSCWSPSAFCGRCCASSTKSATQCARSGACASNPARRGS